MISYLPSIKPKELVKGGAGFLRWEVGDSTGLSLLTQGSGSEQYNLLIFLLGCDSERRECTKKGSSSVSAASNLD